MFDRPEEKKPRNTGRVNNNAENTSSSKTNINYLYIFIGIFVVVGIIGGGIFLYSLGKKSNLPSVTENTVPITEITATRTEEIPFQELTGKYTGSINNQPITVTIFSEGEKKRYSYSKNSRLSYMLFHFPATNDINFHRPKEGLAEFRAFKEGNTIILRSLKVELRKIN
ncbi:hypothetical protein WAF17_12920 [Bernardetia sp. ABR2-2B]|uniref:hypothetical protein n=1 Tax=Bernardetia sp. ABR2-2B TaxID=3127472 RepID=UPI0030CC1093